MTSILPGVTPGVVLQYLRDCRRELEAVRQTFSAFDALAEYQRWANKWAGTLGSALDPSDVTRLVTSQRYWLLQSLATGHAALRELVEVEVAERAGVLDREVSELDAMIGRWSVDRTAAVVLDTSVVLEHHSTLADLEWNALTNQRDDTALVLTIPLAVIRELDEHKRSRAQAPGGQMAVRTQARQALRQIGQWLPTGGERRRIASSAIGRSDLWVSLLRDPQRHAPVADADSEIIDRATTVSPFASQVYLATYDRAQALSARVAGLVPIELEYAD